MAVIVNIHQAKTELSKLLERALAGEEVIIAKAGKPVATLSPIKPVRGRKRTLGSAKGKVWISPDFDAPMPDDWLDAFYNGPIFPDNPLPPSKTVSPDQ
jgi:prevent-host-death family protein